MKINKLDGSVTMKCSKTTTSGFTGGISSSGTASFNQWGYPAFIEVKEVGETIEFIYKQISNVMYTSFPTPSAEIRVFKIVYSCKDGKWNKSEPIIGEIIPAHEEDYEFEY